MKVFDLENMVNNTNVENGETKEGDSKRSRTDMATMTGMEHQKSLFQCTQVKRMTKFVFSMLRAKLGK